MNSISDYTRNFERSANISELRISAKIAEENWAGTDDKVYISMGHHNNFQLFSDAPRVGEIISVDIDISRLFGKQSIHISELQNISLHQVPIAHPIASDNWELESLILTANGVFTNRSFKQIHQWLHASSSHLQQVWAGHINWSDWSNSDNRPVDINTQTYPVRWMPWIGDIKSWRTYDPSTIEGTGQLVGMVDGKLLGELLKDRQTEVLTPNTSNDSYTWVYTPEGAIIYRRWKHESRNDYIRHSQLGSGRPVICAGEFRIESANDGIALRDVIASVNDASGHYQPDGGVCLRYVEEKLNGLGINTDETRWYFRQK